MSAVNKRASRLKPSETLAVKARALELQAQGKRIIDLSAGEPDIDTPQHIKDAALRAMNEGHTKYTAVPGIEALRQAIAEKLERDNGIRTCARDIIVTNGGKQALFELFQVLLEPGDEVVIIAPYWVSYPSMVELAGGCPVVVPTSVRDGFKVSPAALQAVLCDKTRAVIINSPSNPSGATYSSAELAALGEVILPSRAVVVSDEVYEKLTYGGFKFTSFAAACPALAERTVTVNAFSKTYSMTGWRVGYATGPAEIIGAMNRYQSQATSNVCSIAQYAALAALKGPHDFLGPLRESYQRRLAMAMDVLKGVPGLDAGSPPPGAFYLFVRFDPSKFSRGGIKGSASLVSYLLDQAGVAAVPGEAFGDDQAFRISVSSSDENVAQGVQKIAKALSALV